MQLLLLTLTSVLRNFGFFCYRNSLTTAAEALGAAVQWSAVTYPEEALNPLWDVPSAANLQLGWHQLDLIKWRGLVHLVECCVACAKMLLVFSHALCFSIKRLRRLEVSSCQTVWPLGRSNHPDLRTGRWDPQICLPSITLPQPLDRLVHCFTQTRPRRLLRIEFWLWLLPILVLSTGILSRTCWQPCAKHSDRKCAASHFPHEFEESHLSDLSPARQCLTAASSASVKEQYCSCLHATVSECPQMKLNPRQACSGTATSCLSADVLSFLSSTRTRKKHKSDCHMNRMFAPALITTHTHGIAWMLHEHWLRSCNALFLIESQVLYDVLGSPMVLV